jgi:hypothetical protein
MAPDGFEIEQDEFIFFWAWVKIWSFQDCQAMGAEGGAGAG